MKDQGPDPAATLSSWNRLGLRLLGISVVIGVIGVVAGIAYFYGSIGTMFPVFPAWPYALDLLAVALLIVGVTLAGARR